MQVQGIQNDWIIDKTTIKFMRIPNQNEVLDFTFKFESKAPQVQVNLMQKVLESTSVTKEGKALDVNLQSKSIDPMGVPATVGMMYYANKDQEFHA